MGELETLWIEVTDAVREALNNADGSANPWHLEHEFMKAGLGIYRLPDEPEWKARMEAAGARIAVLEKALKPFVESFEKHAERYVRRGEAASAWFEKMPSDWPIDLQMRMNECRSAHSALAHPGTQEGKTNG